MKPLICCWCETEYVAGTVFCSVCNDHKGIMTITDFEDTYGKRRRFK